MSEQGQVRSRRTGVIMVQLGTPAAPTVSAVRAFLREFLMDPRVIDIPSVLRFILVQLIIAPIRLRNLRKSTRSFGTLERERHLS